MSDASKKLINVPNVFKSKLHNIERVWAENGIVNVQLKDGQIRQKKVSKAAQEAVIINKLLKSARIYQPHLVPHHEDLLKKLMGAIRKAGKQIQDGEKGATVMQRVMKNKTPDGKNIEDAVSEDENIKYLKDRYPLVEEHEIAVALRKDDIPFATKERMVAAVNDDRIKDISRQANSGEY